MKHFSQMQRAKHEKLVDRLHTARTTLENAIEAFNAEVRGHWETVRDAHEALQAEIEEANALLSEVRTDAQAYYDDRSEKWQEDDAGSQYQEWLDELENAALEDIEIDAPEDLSDPDFDMIETFEQVRQGVEE